jgi:hypothetical protein
LVRSPSDNSGVAPLKRDGILVTDTVDKADISNNQFQSVFTNKTDTYIPDKGHSPHSKIPQINISSAGVSKLLCNLNPHKACGPDNIHGRVLKELNEQVASILTSIFSKSLKSGEIPKDWKHANVAPAFKNGEKYKAVHYRPITLICISCTIMEHIITSNIMTYLENKSILLFMIFNMASENLDHANRNYYNLFRNLPKITIRTYRLI